MKRNARSASWCGALAAMLLAGVSARADQIDIAMIRDAAAITEAVRGLGAKSVGVLKFQVQVGMSTPTFQAGTLGEDMVRRVENLIALAINPNAPEILVLTEAGEEASKRANTDKEAFDWTTTAGRAKLFGLELPILWDSTKKLAPEGFVTGTVRVAADLKSVEIDLVGFTRKDSAVLRPIKTLGKDGTIHTDRDLLTSMGQTFAVPPRVVTSRGADLRVVNEIAAAEARERAESGTEKAAAVPGPVKLQILYGEREVQPVAGRAGELRVPTPKAGEPVRFRMTNIGTDPVAVLLTVNGRNTLALNGATEDLGTPSARPNDFQLWVLQEPNKPYAVNGFLTDLNGTFKPFEVLSESASVRAYNALSPTYAGKIQMTIFGKAPTVVPPTASEKPTLKEEWPAVAADPPAQKVATATPTPKPEKPAKPVEPEKPTRTTHRDDDDAIRELADGHAAGALYVRLNVGGSGDLAKAQVAMKRGLGINRKPDGTLYLPPKSLGMIGAGSGSQQGASTKRIPFAHDPSPIANVVIGYYAPDAQ